MVQTPQRFRVGDGSLVDSYLDHGFVVLTDLVDERALARVEAEMRAVIKTQLGRFGLASDPPRPLLDELAALHGASIDAYLACVRLSAKLASVMDLYTGPGPTAVARALGIRIPVFQTTPVIHLMAD